MSEILDRILPEQEPEPHSHIISFDELIPDEPDIKIIYPAEYEKRINSTCIVDWDDDSLV